MLRLEFSGQFKRDYKLAAKRGIRLKEAGVHSDLFWAHL